MTNTDLPNLGKNRKNSDEVLDALEMTDKDVLNLAEEWAIVSGYDTLEVLTSIAMGIITAEFGNAAMVSRGTA